MTETSVYTVGHSNRTQDDFLTLLAAHRVERLVDVRTIPRSRRNPQFASDQLLPALAEAGIEYVHLPALGGLRKTSRDSVNTAWRNESFRGYADHMATPEFRNGIGALLTLAEQGHVAIMCAEAVPWRCHRSLIADALAARGRVVEHIMSPTTRRPHRLTPFAVADADGQITYPGVIAEDAVET